MHRILDFGCYPVRFSVYFLHVGFEWHSKNVVVAGAGTVRDRRRESKLGF